jgi:hypothetical protein
MHFLLPICGKFTRAQLAHQIFENKTVGRMEKCFIVALGNFSKMGLPKSAILICPAILNYFKKNL